MGEWGASYLLEGGVVGRLGVRSVRSPGCDYEACSEGGRCDEEGIWSEVERVGNEDSIQAYPVCLLGRFMVV